MIAGFDEEGMLVTRANKKTPPPGTEEVPTDHFSSEIIRTFLDDAPDAVLVTEANGGILFANRQAEVLFGYSHAELLGSQVERLLPERFRPIHMGHRASYHAAPRTRPMGMGLDLFGRRADGTEFPVEISLSPLQTADGQRVISIIRDITERKRLEAALQAAQREADRLKDEFIAIAAHELRNPLAALTGFADMLRVQTARGHGPPLAEWQQEAIADINQAATRLAELTDDLLDVTRLHAGILDLHLAPHDLVALARRVVARQQTLTRRHTLTLAASPACIMLDLDGLRMEQVVTNLINNAIKYSPDGGAITVTIQAEEGAENVTLSVADHGIGIPHSDQARIFGRFVRAENAQGIGGTGLGLYLCRALMERHGGSIRFTSTEGAGSTFTVTLPRHPASPAEA
jgi:two-component system sensor kinase FixL